MRLYRNFILLFLLVSSWAIAQVNRSAEAESQPKYRIEIILYEDKSYRYESAEKFEELETETINSMSNHQSLNQIDQNMIQFTDQYELGGAVKRLQSTGRFNVLIHKTWIQAGLDSNTAIDIPVDSRPSANNSADSVSESETSPVVDNATATTSLHGTVKVVLGRFLHIYTDLIYQIPYENDAVLTEGVKNYRDIKIRHYRKMRSKELHYVDHPLVGLLVKASPVDNEGGESDATVE